MKLNIIKTKKGLYYSGVDGNSYLNYYNYFINGQKPQKSFHNDWFYTDGDDIVIEQEKSIEENKRFELKDKSLSDKFDDNIPHDLYMIEDEISYKYASIAGLYEYKCDKMTILEQIPVEKSVVLELDMDEIPLPQNFVDADITYTPDHPMLAKIIYPKPVLQFTECKLTSRQVYEILRKYILKNIDSKVARVTSNYDFCFDVEKAIEIDEPYEVIRSEKIGRKTIQNKSFIKSRSVKVFSMTYSPENYKGYKPVPELVAKSEEELRSVLIDLCESTMKLINEPLKDCDKCHGYGVLVS